MNQILDLTHCLEEKMPMYPGLGSPKIEIRTTFQSKGCVTSNVSFVSHSGTHLDAPYHFIEKGLKLNEINLKKLVTRPVIIRAKQNQKYFTKEDMLPYQEMITENTSLILDTGIESAYGKEEFLNNFTTLNEEAALWLVKQSPALIATDAVSVDSVDSVDKIIHKTILGNNIPIVEGLKNLKYLTTNQYICLFMPLKIKVEDGCPCRAIAIRLSYLNKMINVY